MEQKTGVSCNNFKTTGCGIKSGAGRAADESMVDYNCGRNCVVVVFTPGMAVSAAAVLEKESKLP